MKVQGEGSEKLSQVGWGLEFIINELSFDHFFVNLRRLIFKMYKWQKKDRLPNCEQAKGPPSPPAHVNRDQGDGLGDIEIHFSPILGLVYSCLLFFFNMGTKFVTL